VRPLLATLTQANLLTEHQLGRYVFHDLLREYATKQGPQYRQRPAADAAIHRLLDYYVHTAHGGDRRMDPAGDPVPGRSPGPCLVL
jgi:hypothetical protein